MAIQNRRGDYNNFDPTKQVAGEFAVVLQNDPNVDDGKAVYITFGAGNVKRLATRQEVEGLVTLAEGYATSAEADAGTAETQATLSESYAVGDTGSRTGEDTDNSKYYKEQAQIYKEYVEGAIDALPPILAIDFATGELLADGGLLLLSINEDTGNLEYLMAGGN